MENIIFDGKYYYLFRALNDGNKKDLQKGIKDIRTDCIRYYEKYGRWGKYNNDSKMSLEEVYDHIKMRYQRDTNCISLTQDANVALTYHPEKPQYVLVKISQEQIGDILNAGEYFFNIIREKVQEIEDKLERENSVLKILQKIDKATSIEEIKKILSEFNPSMSTSSINNRQYLNKAQQIQMSKTNAKLKVLEEKKMIGNIINGVPNSQLLVTMGNAYTSCEYIYYGDIPQELTLDCPKIFIEIFSLLQQAEANGILSENIERISKKILGLINDGYGINEKNRTFSNRTDMINISDMDFKILNEEYTNKNRFRKDLTIDKALELTQGRISYSETNMQLMAIRSIAEMILKKRAILELLKKVIPEEQNIEEILNNTYCINPELVIKQNGRGHQLSNSVNLLITEYGYDLSQEDTELILKKVNELNIEQLIDICIKGIDAEDIKKLLIQTRTNQERIKTQTTKATDIKYMVEAIVEGHDWRKTGKITYDEKSMLARKLCTGDISVEQLKNLYTSINRMVVGKNKFTQSEIFAIMMNMAIEGKFGNVTYQELLKMDNEKRSNLLWKNVNSLQTEVDAISLDILMGRGKAVNDLKRELMDLGIEQEFIEQKDIKNLYKAREIVEGYKFDRELNTKEKRAILKTILKNSRLDKKKARYLNNLEKDFKKLGLSQQETYGAIINLAASSITPGLEQYSYKELIDSSLKVQELNKDKIPTQVSEVTIQKIISDNLLEQDIEQMKEELINLGIEQEFIEQKDIKNIYMAKEIVEGYDVDKKLKKEEKRVLIKCILNNEYLNKRRTYLWILAKKIEDMGFSKQEVNAIIINLGLKGSVTEQTNYHYTNLLAGQANLQDQKKKDINTKVSNIAIQGAISNNLTEKEKRKIKEDLMNLGIEEEFIDKQRINNLYVAKHIIQEYQFTRELDKEEKRFIIKRLNTASLKRANLSTLLQNLERLGLTEQETYGTVINLALNNRIIKHKSDYSYAILVRYPSKVQELYQYRNEIDKDVNEEDIKRAQEKSQSLMKKSVKQLKDKDGLINIETTMRDLQDLQSKENEMSNAEEIQEF